jgi:hypothetical protein
MKFNVKIFNYIYHFFSFIAICFSIYISYDSFIKNKNAKLQITKIYSQKVSDNIYKTRFRIQNIGDKPILNETNQGNLIEKTLKVKIHNIKDFVGLALFSNFEVEVVRDNIEKVIELKFNQWINGDYLDLEYEYEPINSKNILNVTIDKHQIVNAEINYSNELPDNIPIPIIRDNCNFK